MKLDEKLAKRRQVDSILIGCYWIAFVLFCVSVYLTPSVAPWPPIVLFFLWALVFVVRANAEYRSAYNAYVKGHRTFDFLKHKWLNDPSVDTYNLIFLRWFVSLLLTFIIWWALFIYMFLCVILA